MHHRSDRKFSRHRFVIFEAALLALIITLTGALHRLRADTGTCGGATTTLPFTDTMGNFAFCFIAELYFQGITGGTTATTYSPGNNVMREQMAVFISRTLDFSLKRGSQRAALKQWAKPVNADYAHPTFFTSPDSLRLIESDGTDLWIANTGANTVLRARASDGKVLDTWTQATSAFGVTVAGGYIWVTGCTTPGVIYILDPRSGGAAIGLFNTINLGNNAGCPKQITFDGQYLWTANNATSSVARVEARSPYPVTVYTDPAFDNATGILYDGANVWVTAFATNSLIKLDQNGNILQTVSTGNGPNFPVFDGANIWVPCGTGNAVTVVRARDGQVLATLTGNGLSNPLCAAFDGERILVTNNNNGSGGSLWKATDLTPLGSFGGFGTSYGVCSDGIKFWLTAVYANGDGFLYTY